MTRAALLVVVAGCGLDIGPAGPWTPVDAIAPPLAVEMTAAPAMVAPAAGDTLRVITYNIDEENPDGDADGEADAILADPELAQAGVILTQEAERYPGEATSRVARLAARLGMGYVYVPAHERGPGHTHGLAILSAYPLADVEKMDLPLASTGVRRIAVEADVVVGARHLHVIDVHLETYANPELRIAQLRPAVLDAPEATLIGGDFNMSWVEWAAPRVPVLQGSSASDASAVIDSYMQAQGFATPTAGSGPTCWADGLGARCDAFYPRGLAATFGGAPRVGPSDHAPLWIDVTLPAQ